MSSARDRGDAVRAGAASLRHAGHLLIFAALTGLAALAFLWPDPLPRDGRLPWTVAGLALASFVGGWLSRGRRPSLGGWLGGGAVAAVLVVGLTRAVGVELERFQEDRAQREIVAAFEGTAGGSEALDREIERSVLSVHHLEGRSAAAWEDVVVHGLAVAPAAIAGLLGGALGANRRRKRRGEPLRDPAPVVTTARSDAAVDAPNASEPVLARDLRLASTDREWSGPGDDRPHGLR